MYWQGLPLTLVAIAALSVLRGRDAQWQTPAILLADWWICTLTVVTLNDPYPWLMFAVVDWLAVIVLCAIRTSHWQTVIALSYAVELLCHAAYGVATLRGNGTKEAYSTSYDVLLVIAWGQAVLCGLWVSYDIVRGWSGSGISGQFRRKGLARVAEKSR